VRKINDEVIYSATDLVRFLGCEHLTSLDALNLESPLEAGDEDEMDRLIQNLGIEHERAYLQSLRDENRTVVDLGEPGGTLLDQVAVTLEALRGGADVIYQAALRDGPFAGYSDFLERVDTPSALGSYSYEVVDTKLARTPKASYLVQLCFYSSILATLQGRMPAFMHVVLGDGSRASYRVNDYIRYYDALKARFFTSRSLRAVTYPVPCGQCGQCPWGHLCDDQWEQDDHLSRVANIRMTQIRKLNAAGITTMAALAQLPDGTVVPRLAATTLQTLRHQGRLQWLERTSGEKCCELLPLVADPPLGFLRLPLPNAHDLYFDMEGDPLVPGGLEYLFGVGHREEGDALCFRPFWAHSRTEEKAAFEAFMDFIVGHLQRHPSAHIYHYAAYEKTALRRLASMHATREMEVDDLLRQNRLVDLYKVVRESVRVSEPGYSIKNIERFYREARSGDVQEAGASIIYYDRWRQTSDASLLKSIEDYNRDDVESTHGLHRWLLGLRPAELAWRAAWAPPSADAKNETADRPEKLEAESLREVLRSRVEGPETLPPGPERQLAEMALHLIDFHRREQKPQWWKYFDCMEMEAAELLDDAECLGGLTRDTTVSVVPIKRSRLVTYQFPPQETKLRSGSRATRLDTGKEVSLQEVDTENRRVLIKFGPSHDLVDSLNLGPTRPIDSLGLQTEVFRFAKSVLEGDEYFGAAKRLLSKEIPSVAEIAPGSVLVPECPSVDDVLRVVKGLTESYLVVQGPPGSGKTYTGSRVIAGLLKSGYSVGVASNSHKAIHNLLDATVQAARESGFTFQGFKRTRGQDPDTRFDSDWFENSPNIDDFDPDQHRLYAGTAWAFAALPLECELDFLFVDEAGQVSLGNLVAIGTRARNIVLLGDQMQLGQPIQGAHPGRSGESCLEYLMDDRPTIPPTEGVFLPRTWRMHPDVCRFISDAVYEGRLQADGGALHRRLRGEHEVPPTGIRFVPVAHEGCTQSSLEEADRVHDLYLQLLASTIEDGECAGRLLTAEDILVVSPYNLQVNLLQQVLPDGARVGTVDKFQGQEAVAVIVSMATSSAEELPRDIEFLFSKNRLNVAISRAQCLAYVVASPQLLSVRCNTPEQMALVNLLCWVAEYSAAAETEIIASDTALASDIAGSSW
jgi:predicted RecB family nuclease